MSVASPQIGFPSPTSCVFFFGNLRNLFSGLDVEIHHKGLKRNLDVCCTLKNLQKTHGFRWFITLGSWQSHPIWKLGMMERWNPKSLSERTYKKRNPQGKGCKLILHARHSIWLGTSLLKRHHLFIKRAGWYWFVFLEKLVLRWHVRILLKQSESNARLKI